MKLTFERIKYESDVSTINDIKSLISSNEILNGDSSLHEAALDEYIYFCLMQEGRILIGALESRLEKKTMKILNFIIAPRYQNCGFGSLFLAMLEKYAEENKYEKVSLIAGGQSKGFYEKNCYQYDGMFHHKYLA